MDEHCKTLAFQFDVFVNRTLKFLDTTTESDYLIKLKLIDELTYRIDEGENDKNTIKNTLEAVQEECSKLHYKLKTSARLLDDAQIEKEKLEIEKENLKSQLDQLYSVFKKPHAAEKIQKRLSNHSDCVKEHEKKTLNNTDALLSDISYSNSEDSSFENVVKNHKHGTASVKKFSESNIQNNMSSKPCQFQNSIDNGQQIIATTTLTMDLGRANFKSLNMDINGVNVKSVTKTYNTPISVTSSSSDSEELSFNEPKKKFLQEISKDIDKNIKKKHNFIQKFIVIPEMCSQCHKKVKFNNCMVKCDDCKIIAHLECKGYIPDICTGNQNQVNTLNLGIPPLMVHCINEIEKRGLNTVGLYKVSVSDKEVKILRDGFRKGVPNLNYVDIHLLCCCLKDFLLMKKNHLISHNDFSKLVEALKKENESSRLFQHVILEIPSINRKILAFLILHLKKVACSQTSCMDYSSLASIFGPTIVDVSDKIKLNDLQIETEILTKVLVELLKLPEGFWLDSLKTDSTSSDELLHSTPTRSQSQTPKSAHRFFSSGIKKRILDSPQKIRVAKQVKYHN